MRSRTTWYILAPTLLVSGLLLLVGLTGALYTHRANQQVSDSLDASLATAQATEQLVFELRDVRLKLDQFVDTGHATLMSAAIQALPAIRERATSLVPPEVMISFDRLGERLVETQRLTESLQRDEARSLIAFLNGHLLDDVQETLDARQAAVRATSRQNLALARRIGHGLLLLGTCGAAAGLLIGFGIARGIHRSLVEISVPVRNIAGRLNEVVGPITVAADSDLHELDSALRMLADKTADVVQQLQLSQFQTLRSEQLAAVGQLAAGLAHELRNPLMSIKLILQVAAERPNESLRARDLGVIEDEILRLEKMLQTFLDFARPPLPAKQMVDVCDIIDQAVEVMQTRADQQDVRLHWKRTATPLRVDADATQLRQVLMNLIINGFDALPGGGNIWLSTDCLKVDCGESESVTISVIDDGPGIPPLIAERLFEPFISSKVTGIGLGLSISRRIVESHGGTITAASLPRGGAEFVVTLPVSFPLPSDKLSVALTHSCENVTDDK